MMNCSLFRSLTLPRLSSRSICQRRRRGIRTSPPRASISSKRNRRNPPNHRCDLLMRSPVSLCPASSCLVGPLSWRPPGQDQWQAGWHCFSGTAATAAAAARLFPHISRRDSSPRTKRWDSGPRPRLKHNLCKSLQRSRRQIFCRCPFRRRRRFRQTCISCRRRHSRNGRRYRRNYRRHRCTYLHPVQRRHFRRSRHRRRYLCNSSSKSSSFITAAG